MTHSKFQSLAIFVVCAAAVCGVLWVVWRITMDIVGQTQAYFDSRQIKISSSNLSIPVKAVSRERIVEAAQRGATKAWLSSANVDGNNEKLTPDKVPRMMRLREWKDRRRSVYGGTATQAANEGFYDQD